MLLTTNNHMQREGQQQEKPDIRLSFANHVNGNTWDEPEPAYLDIITRCFRRKEKLGKNQRSITNQTDGSWRQILIHDETVDGIGYDGANKLFEDYRHLVKSDYVLLLDDDDLLIDDDFVKKLKDRDEDIIMFKMRYTQCGKDRWSYIGGEEFWHPPELGRVGGSCFVVKNHVYQRHIHMFQKGVKMHNSDGDHAFIREILKPEYGYTTYHMGDKPVTAVQAVGNGQPDDAPPSRV